VPSPALAPVHPRGPAGHTHYRPDFVSARSSPLLLSRASSHRVDQERIPPAPPRSITRDLAQASLAARSADGDFVVLPVQATDDPKSVGAVDIVLLAVKGWQAPGAIDTMRPLMGPEIFAVPLLDVESRLQPARAAFGEERVVAGLAVMLGMVVAPGHIRNTLGHHRRAGWASQRAGG